jgi:hypothetical protein
MKARMKDKFLTCMKCSGLLNDSMHGFLKNKSTTTHLLECRLDWNVALQSKKAVDVNYDFTKALDSVVLSKLIAKLIVLWSK